MISFATRYDYVKKVILRPVRSHYFVRLSCKLLSLRNSRVSIIFFSCLIGANAEWSEASISESSRLTGSLMASQIGDALAMPRQYYYQKNAFDMDTPEGIQHYLAPSAQSNSHWAKIHQQRRINSIHAGMVTQNMQLVRILIKSITDRRSFDREHFLRRVDAFISGLKADSYQGRFTGKLVQDIIRYRRRASWPDEGAPGISNAETSEGAQLMAVLAAFYRNPVDLIQQGQPLLKTLYTSQMLISMQLAYGLTVQGLINGVSLVELKHYLRMLHENAIIRQAIPNPDTIVAVYTGEAALGGYATLNIKNPIAVTEIYGRGTSLYQILPAAYFFLFYAKEDVNKALISAANSLGDSADCSALTGALSGAISGITPVLQWIDELEEGELYRNLAERIADLRRGKMPEFSSKEEDLTEPVITPFYD